MRHTKNINAKTDTGHIKQQLQDFQPVIITKTQKKLQNLCQCMEDIETFK